MPRPDTPLHQLLDAAVARYRAGDFGAAQSLCEQALHAQPESARALHLAGLIAKQHAHWAQAIEYLARANQTEAHNPFILRDLAETYRQAGDSAAALPLLRLAIERAPELPDLYSALGLCSEAQGDFAAAVRAHAQVVALLPRSAAAHNNLGGAQRRAGDHEAAKSSFEAALALEPRLADACYNLGNLALEASQFDAAIAAFARYVDIDPGNPPAWNNLGAACLKTGAHARAIACFATAAGLAPGHPAAVNHAITLLHLGQQEAALAAFAAIQTAQANNPTYWRYYAMALLYLPDQAQTLRAVLQEFNQRFVLPLLSQTEPAWDFTPSKATTLRKLRIGYLSSDFREHPVARNLLPVLQHHDRSRFEIFLYASIGAPDAMTAQLQQACDHFQMVSHLDDASLAKQMREQGLDVLVLLAWRFDTNRPLVAAHRPAPVCVSYHDPGSSGMASIHYLIGDKILAPKSSAAEISERVLHLPSYYLHLPPTSAPPVTSLPSLEKNGLCFASFNNPAKLQPSVIALWAELLKRLPDARLVLKYQNIFADAYVREPLAAQFTALGVEPERVRFIAAQESLEDHLARYGEVDISLDPVPFNGSTTSFESLWMGVPIITLRGDTMVGRWGASILTQLGLSDWIASDSEAYLSIAAHWAQNQTDLSRLRADLRVRVATSRLCDAPRYTRHWERALRAMCARAGSKSPTRPV